MSYCGKPDCEHCRPPRRMTMRELRDQYGKETARAMPLARMRKTLSMGGRGSYADVADRIEWVVGKYSRICARLQECCQRHRLGLGGEEVDAVVVATLAAALDALRALVNAQWPHTWAEPCDLVRMDGGPVVCVTHGQNAPCPMPAVAAALSGGTE